MRRIKIGMISEYYGPVPTPTQKIYLKRLYDRGYVLDQLILFEQQKQLDWKHRVVYGLCGPRVGRWLAANKHRITQLFRNQAPGASKEEALYRQMIESQEKLDEVFFSDFRLQDYCDNIEYLTINSFDDACFIDTLKSSGLKHFIYACHPILRGRPFELGIDYILVHPGILPEIGGVNCLVWSLLYRERLGYSVININKGIDTGDIILSREFAPPQFRAKTQFSENDYVRFFSFIARTYNPQKKADLLVEAIEKIVESGYACSLERQTGIGRQFYRTHPAIVQQAMKKIVV